MAEGARLESVYTGNRIAGSNPALSASPKREELASNFLLPAVLPSYFQSPFFEVGYIDQPNDNWLSRLDDLIRVNEIAPDHIPSWMIVMRLDRPAACVVPHSRLCCRVIRTGSMVDRAAAGS